MNTDLFPSIELDAKSLEYFSKNLGENDSYKTRIMERMKENNIPMMSVTPFEGHIISTYVRAINPKKAVEIGTLCGYSSMWILEAMEDSSRLYTIEKNPLHYSIASKIFEETNMSKRAVIIQDEALPALEKLSKLAPFDFCFIDADKENGPEYIKWCVNNLRSGGLVLAHNPFLKGNLFYDGGDRDQNKKSRGMREFLHQLFKEDNFSSRAVIPSKDGLAVGIKR